MSTKSNRPKKSPRPRKTKEDESNPGFKMPDLSDQRIPKIIGLILICISLILIISMTSYLLTFKADQSEVLFNEANALSDNDIQVNNALGRLGAVLAHNFIYKMFGIGSLLFGVMGFTIGTNLLMRRKVFPNRKIIGFGSAFIIGSSAFLAYLQAVISPDAGFPLGGAFGNFLTGTNGWITGFLSPLGTGLVFAFLFLGLAVWFFDIKFERILDVFKKDKILADSEATEPVIFGSGESIFEKDQIEESAEAEIELKKDVKGDAKLELELETPIREEPIPSKSAIEEDEGSIELEPKRKQPKKEESLKSDLALDIAESVEEKIIEKSENEGNYDPTLDLSNYKYPPLSMLADHGSGVVEMDAEELQRNKDQIVGTLNNYNIEISKIKATIGPTVTLYEIVPAPGVRISKIKNLEDDIALSLAALGIRIIAPIPGKGTIGIEVPNTHPETVSMKTLLSSEKFRNTKHELPVALGKNIANEILVYDLAKMPHMLMAGATGQGKSVGINSILISLLYKKHPSQLKFVLIDPKKVELSIYNKIEKHFLAMLPGEEEAIITDVRKVVQTLNSLCIEMDDRYELLKNAGTRNIKEYNQKFTNRKLNPQNGHRFLPYIVLIIDEFADLIMTAGKEVETPIARLAQLARAIGIHLILATQRPSVNIITGVIKANFPARISFKVTSKVDSRTILDTGGADQLIGRGDLLFSNGSDLTRLQCGFVDTPEVEEIVSFIGDQQGYAEPHLLPEVPDESGDRDGSSFVASERDAMFADAARLVVQNQVGSTSLIQRRLKLGYNRAGRLMDQLEDAGIVGPNLGSKARDVLFSNETELEQFLESLNKQEI